ncbi:NodT family efflux transporter outer membrane factor (OMF) lipoprotein [Rhodanobacter sp. ANJX3]|uniref:efflux transporter outer membrane subunit n=1 Tax=Rhodanobacter sp. ANJX3 TaxID=2723083 RepID=UPI00162010F7|nr:efflux transporter outer membrane subunit [Rhodanobacter sp. ANJX3]MBB5359343.1 NodT family efflux transporter outer membrane factor (OMF) lipoprotein [Rhodanobacter sp. ANJX3]
MTVFNHRRLPRAAARLAVLLTPLFVAGCMVGPDFKQPPAPPVDRYAASASATTANAGGDAQRFVTDMQLPAQWWMLFHSPALNQLITQALASNPGMQSARAALRQAQENVAAQKGSYYPSVDAGINTTRQRNPSTLSSPLESNANYYTLTTAQVSVSYMPDIFGGNRRAVESLQAQADAQRFQLEATYLTLTSNVALAAIQEAGLRAQIAATHDIVDSQTKVLATVRREFALGQLAESDVAAQVALLAQAQATLPPLEKQLAQQRDALAALLGLYSSDDIAVHFDLAELQLPHDLPLSIPSQLVRQRPDVRAAQAQWHAANAQVGVAIANRFPKLTLSAGAGSSPTRFNDLFKDATNFWSLGAGVAQPIFEGGSLLHQERAAKAANEQAEAQYRTTVVAAFQNVADTLFAIRSDADTLAAAQTSSSAAAKSLAIAQRQLALGDISEVALLNAQQTAQQAQIAVASAQASRYADTVALFQALGGGWWNRQEPIGR